MTSTLSTAVVAATQGFYTEFSTAVAVIAGLAVAVSIGAWVVAKFRGRSRRRR